MVGRDHASEPYRIIGWSFRLFPEAIPSTPANRGSAFNSAQAMSHVPTVDAVYLISKEGVSRFQQGDGREDIGKCDIKRHAHIRGWLSWHRGANVPEGQVQ
jgi:hypothetical protein